MVVEKTIFELVAPYGVWAVLFVMLLFYVLRNGEKREERLVAERKESEEKATLREEKLMTHLDTVTGLTKDVDQVKTCVNEMKGDIKEIKGKLA